MRYVASLPRGVERVPNRLRARDIGAQAADDTLTALAALDATAGLLEQTGADAFTKRALGVAAATSVLTRGDGDARYALTAHTHVIADVTGLQAALDGKQSGDDTLTALAGLNATAGLVEQTGADTFTKRALGTAAATSVLTRGDGDARFAPLAHTHVIADVTGLQAALDGKQPLDADLTAIAALTTTAFGRSFLDRADAAAGRTLLALGTAAVKNTGVSGDAVPLLNGNATFSGYLGAAGVRSTASPTFGGTGAGTEIAYSGGIGYIYSFNRNTSSYTPLRLEASSVVLCNGSTNIVTVSATGADVLGEVRGDSLRIDAAPSASAATTTHKLAINLNGTTYYLLLSNV